MRSEFYRELPSGILYPSKDEREYERTPDIGCCSLHCMPAGSVCEDYTLDTGGGILIDSCTNCWHFNDRSKRYKKREKVGNRRVK